MRVGCTVSIVALVACGRLGFDASELEIPPPNEAFIVSRTQLTPAASFSWVDIEVDWDRSLAYVGSRPASGICVAVVDFADERAPAVIGTIADADNTCLDVYLFEDRRRLAVLSFGANRVTFWDLGNDPRDGAFSLIAELGVAGGRHLSVEADGRFLVPTGDGVTAVTLDAGNTASTGASYIGTCTEPYQTAIQYGDHVALGCQADHSTLHLLRRSDLTLESELVNDTTGLSGYWTGTTLPDGRAFVLGWVGVVLADTGAVLDKWQYQMGARGVFAVDNDTVWIAGSDGTIERLSIAGAPRTTGRDPLGLAGEVYGLSINATSSRGVAITNQGAFVVFDPRVITPTDLALPAN